MEDPRDTVRRFLAALEARDLEAARALLAPGATMRFPGAAPFASLEEVVAWSRPRYRFVAKSFDGWDVARDGTVWCRGTLRGEWPDGTPFAGIRFVDRFEVRSGLIAAQEVWNDMALHMPAAA
jgi:ketosteroid isomerase-like protein